MIIFETKTGPVFVSERNILIVEYNKDEKIVKVFTTDTNKIYFDVNSIEYVGHYPQAFRACGVLADDGM